MKLAIASLLAGSAVAFTPPSLGRTSKTVSKAFTIDTIPGALEPMGIWDPLGFATDADEATLRKYREAEVTHGRVAMLAAVGFLVGEAVEGSTFLFDSQITGSAIDQFAQVPVGYTLLLVGAIGFAELQRAKTGWVDPADTKFDQPGQLKAEYYPGDIGKCIFLQRIANLFT